jgi:outer membrane autotransporter protein
MKAIILAGAASLLAAPAMAGPYVNVETNAGYTGDDFEGSVTDLHVGYEGELGQSASWYVQGGPALVAADGEETETEISGKAGLGVDVTEQLNLYGEVSFQTADQDFNDDLGLGVKAGVKYSF